MPRTTDSAPDPHDVIVVRGARQNNLKDVSLDIPKRQLTVFTGVSGSGKSSLVFGTIAAESRRLINETYTAFIQGFMPSQSRPDVDGLANLSAAIIVDQERMGANSRSTVGTATDAYSMLRLVFSRIGEPNVGYSHVFSFNDPAGMCQHCEGMGQVSAVDVDAVVDRQLSLNDGAITLPGFAVGSWMWKVFALSGYFDADKKISDYTDAEWDRLWSGPAGKVTIGEISMTYQGLLERVQKGFLAKDMDSVQPHIRRAAERIATFAPCPECGGTRLNATVLGCRIPLGSGAAARSVNIAECAAMQVSDLAAVVAELDDESVAPLVENLGQILDNLVQIGLGYLSLDRPSGTLSGGEAQRVKMVRHLGSALSDVTYVFDEPTVGLHPHDVQRMNDLLLRLRDKGNTVLVVEHEAEVIEIADHVVDLGPGAGTSGGELVYAGDVAGLRASDSRTGRHLGQRQQLREQVRTPDGAIRIENATVHNLKGVSVDVPTGVLTVVTGVAGSGKSSLINGSLPRSVDGQEVAFLDQSPVRGSRRSNPATYTGLLDLIRKAFAKATGKPASLFSANSAGACPDCKGIGVIYTDLAFMAGVSSRCETCQGRRFTAEVLGLTMRGQNIFEVLSMTMEQAREYFTERAERGIRALLDRLVDVGLPYLTLGQPLSTLSGGERQRIKLAIRMSGDAQVFVLDEPTSGLHMADVDQLIALLDRLVDDGRTVIVIEHNLDVIARADHLVDIGPGAGHDGGSVVFTGSPADLVATAGTAAETLTGRHLARYVAGRDSVVHH